MKLAIAILLLVVGALATIAVIGISNEVQHAERIRKLEADVRTYAGRYLDQQEVFEEERQVFRSAASVAEYQLADCRKGAK